MTKVMKKDILMEKESNEGIIAQLPKDTLKSLFYLFAGKPDSKYKVFKRRVIIDVNDIRDLNTKIVDKLKMYHTDATITSVSISFEKEQSIDFRTWAEFETYDWKKPYRTREVTIRWEFLIDVPNYKIPQKHTLTVKISHPPNPREFFQMLLSQDPDEDDSFNEKMGICLARVDFISHRLADELIDIVQEWNESLKSHSSNHNWFSRLVKNDNNIAHLVHLSLPGFVLIIIFKFILFLHNYWIVNSIDYKDVVADSLKFVLISFISVYLMNRLGKIIASKCYKSLNEYGTFAPFQLTRGDTNRNEDINRRNVKQIRNFVINIITALIINIVSAVIAFYILQ